MTIGTRIQTLRIQKGYTQEYLANQLGISRQAVHKWEKNETRPDTDNLILLAEILGTTVEYIAVGDIKSNNNKKSIPLWIKYIFVIIVTAVITFAATVLYIANQPVSFDAGACGGGFATAVYDQYADRLIEDNYFYLTRDIKDKDVVSISPVRETRDVKYEGKAIYMSFDIVYTFGDFTSKTEKISFVGERKWIQNYKWRMLEL
ncbi:MAG: helix-turn-helix transcriptional regulator [Oscillospiraceae bacterium]|nr:helix-turn-helix transcriptional regulator [Oscillospiraceae bacterium]